MVFSTLRETPSRSSPTMSMVLSSLGLRRSETSMVTSCETLCRSNCRLPPTWLR